MLRNMATSLIQHERIRTTEAKAKELRPVVEKLITLGGVDDVHSRRRARRVIDDRAALRKLFDEIGPRFRERPGGYTRILKLGPRKGDGAELAIIELTE
jgi:large subunit ribosomal protein L17